MSPSEKRGLEMLQRIGRASLPMMPGGQQDVLDAIGWIERHLKRLRWFR